jgi:hypothetical protein
MSNLYKSLKDFLDGKKPKVEVEAEIIKSEENVNLTPFEESLNYLYMGCYNDSPTQPTIPTELGNVQNQLECIKAGQKSEFKYVALQSGNECLASNNLNFKNMEETHRKNCNIVCDESSAGFCGGVLKNQIYATSLLAAKANENTANTANKANTANTKESFRQLENFVSHNKEMNLINKNISQIDMMCEEPINKYNLFLSLLIVLLLLHILMEYIYKK